MKKITIAIDGCSSTGKSTLAKQLAQALHYVYIDTGAMYRAVALFALEKGYLGATENIPALLEDLPNLQLEFKPNTDSGRSEIHLNGNNVEQAIRTMAVSQHVSRVATIGAVRHLLVSQQQQMGRNKGVVMDGRDIGTVVFPDAELKIFLKADLDTRATRRYKELQNKGIQVTYDEVRNNLQERDLRDATRDIAPLRQAEDAIALDNSNMTLEAQFEQLYRHALAVIDKAS